MIAAGTEDKSNSINIDIMKKILQLFAMVSVLSGCAQYVDHQWEMKGVVLHVDDLNTLDWPE